MNDDRLAERLAEAIVEIGRVRGAFDTDDFGPDVSIEAIHGLLDRIEARLHAAWQAHRRSPSQLSRHAVNRALTEWDELWLTGGLDDATDNG